MRYIAKVQTNLKAGADLEIGPKTIIVGPNGAGKSTLINAIELALTGRAGDIAGRTDIAQEASVLALAPPGHTSVWSRIVFDDGSVAEYKAEGTVAKAKKAVRKLPNFADHADVLPIRSLRDAVLGSSQTARKFLVSRGLRVEIDEVREMLPPHVREQFDQLRSLVPPADNAADTLVAVMEKAASKQRESTKNAGAFQKVADAFAGTLSAPPTEADVELARSRAHDFATFAFNAKNMRDKASELYRLKEQLEQLKGQEDEYAARFQEAKDALEKIPTPDEPPLILTPVQQVIDYTLSQGPGTECLACGSVPNRNELMERAGLIAKTITDFAEGSRTFNEAKRAFQVQQNEVTNYLGRVDNLESQIQHLEAASHLIPSEQDVQQAERDAEAAQKSYGDMAAARKSWESVQHARSGAATSQVEAEEWSSFVDSCRQAMDNLLQRGISGYVTRVRGILPPADSFDLSLQAGDREVVQFGLTVNGHLRTALSGAEWARVTAAMASACVSPGAFAVIMPEERAFDADTLRAALEAMSNCPHQIVITSPIAPRRVVKGWKVIKRGLDTEE